MKYNYEIDVNGLTIKLEGREYKTPKLTKPVDGRLIYGNTRIEADKIPNLYTLKQVEEAIVRNIVDGTGTVYLTTKVGYGYRSNINVLLKNHILELSSYNNSQYELHQHNLKDTDVCVVYLNELGKTIYTKNGKTYMGDKVLDTKVDDIRSFDEEKIYYTDGSVYGIPEAKYYGKKHTLLDGSIIALADDGTYTKKDIKEAIYGSLIPSAAIVDGKVFPFDGYEIFCAGFLTLLYKDLELIVATISGIFKKYKIRQEDKHIILSTIKGGRYIPYGDTIIEGFYDAKSLISYKHDIVVKDNGIYKGDTMVLDRFGDIVEKEEKGDIVSFILDDGTNNTFIVMNGGSDIFSVKVSKNKRAHKIVGEKVCLVDRSTLTVFHMDESRTETINLNSTLRNLSAWMYRSINISEHNGKVLVEYGNEVLAVIGG